MSAIARHPSDGDEVEGSEPRPIKRHSLRPAALGVPAAIALYVLISVLILPYGTPVVDEPIFAKSAFEFARSGQIRVSNLSAPNAVFDTIWGGLFAGVLGESYQSLRISTIVLAGLSAPFLFLLCRTLGGSRSVAILGVFAYLFAPLAFPLSVTFQTDSHFTALMVMATSVVAHGLNRATHQIQFLLLGSAFTAMAFLSRPQALVLTIAAVLIWLYRTRDRVKLFAGVSALAAMPAVTLFIHAIWTASVGEPYIRELYRNRLQELNPQTYPIVAAQTFVDGLIYIGIFTLPIVPLLMPAVRRAISDRRPLVVGAAVCLAFVAIGLLLSHQGPLIDGSWLSSSGLGAVDGSLLGSRPSIPPWLLAMLIVGSAASTCALAFGLAQAERTLPRRFVVLALLGLVAGALVSTLGAHPRVLDRYWLPLVPLVVALAMSAVYVTRTRLLAAWSLVTVLALLSVIGTIDAFTTYRAASDFADDIVSEGIDPLALDGGASWSAATFGLNDNNPEYLNRPGPFWIKFYAVDSDPEYGIALGPLEGYEVLERREYRSRLHPGPNYLYLVHRDPELPFYIRQSDF